MSAIQDEIAEAIAPMVREIQRLSEQISSLQAKTPDELVTTTEASKILGVSVQTLRKWVKEGKVPCERKGKKMLFRKNDLITN